MPVLPDSDLGRVEFMEAHLALWTTNAVAIGLTAAQVTAMGTATTAARTGYNGQQAAKAAAKAATANFHNLTRTLSDLASDAIKAIKLKAAQNNDPNVFVLANIPAPQPPSPPGPPEPPTDLVADPNADGTITLKWKGSVANSTFFSVWRKLGASPTWTNIGSTAVKTFLDSAVPGSPIPASITYAVRSQRNNEVSAPSVQAEVVYGGPGIGFFAGAEALAFSAEASPESATNGTQRRAA